MMYIETVLKRAILWGPRKIDAIAPDATNLIFPQAEVADWNLHGIFIRRALSSQIYVSSVLVVEISHNGVRQIIHIRYEKGVDEKYRMKLWGYGIDVSEYELYTLADLRASIRKIAEGFRSEHSPTLLMHTVADS